MKGMSEFLGLFMKIMQIFFVVIALVSVFFTITDYQINITVSEGTRESILVAQAALSAPCLTVEANDGYPVRGLFNENELISLSATDDNPSCLSYPTNILLEFEVDDSTIEVGKKNILVGQSVWYPAALQKTDGNIVPIVMKVNLEGIPVSTSDETITGGVCTRPNEYVCIDGLGESEILDGFEHQYLAKCVDYGDEMRIDASTIEDCENYYSDGSPGGDGYHCGCWYWLRNTANEAGCYDSGNFDTCTKVD